MSDVKRLSLEEWLRAEAQKHANTARIRRGYAASSKNLTPEDRKEAQRIAEQMAGRKLPRSTALQDEAHAQIQEKIAIKCEGEAAMLNQFADELLALRTSARRLAEAAESLAGNYRFYEDDDDGSLWMCNLCYEEAEVGKEIQHEETCSLGRALTALADPSIQSLLADLSPTQRTPASLHPEPE